MKYNSIGEYFYRLSNRCLGLILLPVILILAAYLINHYFFTGLPWLNSDREMTNSLLIAETVVMVVFIPVITWITSLKLKPLIVEPSLSKRIVGYIQVVLSRFRSFSLMLLLIGTSVFSTGQLMHLILLPIPVALTLLYWPFRFRMSKDLRLLPQEKDILSNSKLGV